MSKTYNVVLFSIEMLFSLVFLTLTIMFIVASVHNIKMNEEIKEFIDKATFEFQDGSTYYYTVETEGLDCPTINTSNSANPILGTTGDIFLMPQSRMNYVPFFAEFVSFLFGGHAGVIIDNGNRIVEAMGGSANEGYVFNYSTDLYSEERTIIGIRVNATKEERETAAANAISLVNKKYNYLFVLNTDGNYYCTDLCSRVYGEEFGMNYNIDTNGFHVSLQDLFRSNDTYITFVKYKIGNQTHIYYLKNK